MRHQIKEITQCQSVNFSNRLIKNKRFSTSVTPFGSIFFIACIILNPFLTTQTLLLSHISCFCKHVADL